MTPREFEDEKMAMEDWRAYVKSPLSMTTEERSVAAFIAGRQSLREELSEVKSPIFVPSDFKAQWTSTEIASYVNDRIVKWFWARGDAYDKQQATIDELRAALNKAITCELRKPCDQCRDEGHDLLARNGGSK